MPRKGKAKDKARSKERAKERKIKAVVKDGYGRIAKGEASCCNPLKTASSCGCGAPRAEDISRGVGYTSQDLRDIPEGADLGLGCGNPVAMASLKKGETVLDLGSGAGIDCFLAAKRVGPKGWVIGVDMTPEMVERARTNAETSGYRNVEFRLGEIEHLPVEDRSVDVIISNCVINLCPDKSKAFKEAFRVIRPGGRLMVSDIVLTRPLPDEVKGSISAYVGCIAGAMLKDEYIGEIKKAGFKDVMVVDETAFNIGAISSDPVAKAIQVEMGISKERLAELASTVRSAKVSARRP